MKFNNLGIVVGMFALSVAACPEPTSKRAGTGPDMGGGVEEGMGGAGKGGAGMGGAGKGGAGMGGAGMGGAGMGGAGMGGAGMGGAGMGGAGMGGKAADAGAGMGGKPADAGAPKDGPSGGGTYAKTIWPILMKNCTKCHGGTGIAGLGEMGAYNYLQMNHGMACDGKMMVKRCVALQYKLDSASTVMCGNKMPKDTMGITDAPAIAALKAWATAGCPM